MWFGRLAPPPFQSPVAARRLARADENAYEFVRLLVEDPRRGWLDDTCLDKQLQPECSFVSLFDHDAEFRNEVLVGTASAYGSIIGANGRTTAKQLPRDDPRFVCLRERPAESDHIDREDLCPMPKFLRSHAGDNTHATCPREQGRVS